MSKRVSQFNYSNIFSMRCYAEHKPLSLGGDYFIFGGSCIDHDHLEADIYVGLDDAMLGDSSLYPWNDKQGVLFNIRDMGVPESFEEFDKMIDWIHDNIKNGKIVHVGCLGGHGRTGLVLSALSFKMLGIEDSITYVRDNYCDQAVETLEQEKWLNKYYGISQPKKSFHTGISKHFPCFHDYDDIIDSELFDNFDFDDDGLDENYLDIDVFPMDEKSSLSLIKTNNECKLENTISLDVFEKIEISTIIENLGEIFEGLDESIFGIVDQEVVDKNSNHKGYHLTLYFMDIYFDEAYIMLDDDNKYAYITNSISLK